MNVFSKNNVIFEVFLYKNTKNTCQSEEMYVEYNAYLYGGVIKICEFRL